MLPVPRSADTSSLNLSLPAFIIHQLQTCMSSTSGRYTILSSAITSCLLVLPFCILVLCQGLHQCRGQSSNIMSSNFHVFTYHLATIEIVGTFGYMVFFCGTEADLPLLMTMGIELYLFTSVGQMFFHIFASVERYLAVVHPIAYRTTMREAKAIKFRNVAIGCAWLLSFGAPCFAQVKGSVPVMSMISNAILSYVVYMFLSLSVVCRLTAKGPGTELENTKKSGPKLRAFYSLLVILAVVSLGFAGHMIQVIYFILSYFGKAAPCASVFAGFWFGLPSSLVLPLLYLHKARKLPCCRDTTNQERVHIGESP